METTLKTFFAVHKTKIMIACASLIIGAKAMSFISTQQLTAQNQAPAVNVPQQQQAPARYNEQQAQQQQGNNAYATEQGYYGNEQTYNNAGYATYATYGGSAYNNAANNSAPDYTNNYYNQQKSNDRTSANFSDYILEQANYSDGYGNTYKLNSGYDNSYVNTTTGEYMQSNDANYDPNAYSTSSWTAVTPTSGYESSSSSSYSSSTGDE